MPRLAARAGWLSVRRARDAEKSTSATGRDGDAEAWTIPGGPRLARAIVLAVLSAYAANQMIDLVTSPLPSHGAELAVDAPAIVVLYALTVWVTSASAEHWPPWHRQATVLAEGLVTFLPIIVFGRAWGDMAGYFAGSALLLLSGWVAWTLFAAAVGSMVVVSVLSGLSAYLGAYLTLSTLILGLVVFGLGRLSLLIRYMYATRGELAQLAVINERMRFARDLHDLLGYSLSAITLKAEFTRRVVGSNPGRARDELAEVLDIARQALADVRAVASGYRSISLAKEASSVASLLAAAGIDAQVDISCGVLDEKVDTALATVLREAVTNILRHSAARNCAIKAGIAGDSIRLEVVSDGVQRSTAASARHGGGLENLSTRMAAIGGQLTAGVRPDNWFSVLAEAPFTSIASDEPAPEAEAEAG